MNGGETIRSRFHLSQTETFMRCHMGAKTSSSDKDTGNTTGKTGNDSGSNVKEARGPAYEEHHGKHPPNKIYTGPKDMHPPKQVPQRNSDKG